MVQNRFRPYNKSLLVNVFMNNEYKAIWSEEIIPTHDYIKWKSTYLLWSALIRVCNFYYANIIRLLLSHHNVDIDIKNYFGSTAFIYTYGNQYIINLLKQHNAK